MLFFLLFFEIQYFITANKRCEVTGSLRRPHYNNDAALYDLHPTSLQTIIFSKSHFLQCDSIFFSNREYTGVGLSIR